MNYWKLRVRKMNKEIPLTIMGIGFLAFPFGYFAYIPGLVSFCAALWYNIKRHDNNTSQISMTSQK